MKPLRLFVCEKNVLEDLQTALGGLQLIPEEGDVDCRGALTERPEIRAAILQEDGLSPMS